MTSAAGAAEKKGRIVCFICHSIAEHYGDWRDSKGLVLGRVCRTCYELIHEKQRAKARY